MTVRELIEALGRMPGDALVTAWEDMHESAGPSAINSVYLRYAPDVRDHGEIWNAQDRPGPGLTAFVEIR